MPDALTDRLRDAAGWVERQNTPAPDWDALLAEAADEIERLRRERDSLARRCSVRFEETEAALAVVRQYAARWTPDLDTGLWWRNDLRTSRPITSSEMTALRRSFDDAPEPTGA